MSEVTTRLLRPIPFEEAAQRTELGRAYLALTASTTDSTKVAAGARDLLERINSGDIKLGLARTGTIFSSSGSGYVDREIIARLSLQAQPAFSAATEGVFVAFLAGYIAVATLPEMHEVWARGFTPFALMPPPILGLGAALAFSSAKAKT